MRNALGISIVLLLLSPAANADWVDDGNIERTGQGATTAQAPGHWVNPNTGVVGTFTSDQVYVDARGRDCREYAVEATIAGHVQQIFGLACLDANGRWHESSSDYQPPTQTATAAPSVRPAPTYSDLWAPYYPGPPARSYSYGQPGPYYGWDWWVPFASVALSASYCVDGFCFGGSTGVPGYYGYRSRGYGYGYGWNPFRLGFGYYGNYGYYGKHRHYGHKYKRYRHHGNYKHHKKYKKHKKYRKHRAHKRYRRHGGRDHGKRQYADRSKRGRGKRHRNNR